MKRKAYSKKDFCEEVIYSMQAAQLFADRNDTFSIRGQLAKNWRDLTCAVKAVCHDIMAEPYWLSAPANWDLQVKKSAETADMFGKAMTLNAVKFFFLKTGQTTQAKPPICPAPNSDGSGQQWTLKTAKNNHWFTFYRSQGRSVILRALGEIRCFGAAAKEMDMAFHACHAMTSQSTSDLFRLGVMDSDPDIVELARYCTLGGLVHMSPSIDFGHDGGYLGRYWENDEKSWRDSVASSADCRVAELRTVRPKAKRIKKP